MNTGIGTHQHLYVEDWRENESDEASARKPPAAEHGVSLESGAGGEIFPLLS